MFGSVLINFYRGVLPGLKGESFKFYCYPTKTSHPSLWLMNNDQFLRFPNSCGWFFALISISAWVNI